ncbi:MAG: NAD(P)H-binding protein [Planctomycetota bacterium]
MAESVMVTGATGFVGRSVVRSLLARGLKPICLVRSREKLLAQHRDVDPERLTAIVGNLRDYGALREADPHVRARNACRRRLQISPNEVGSGGMCTRVGS